jgi:hypothetical protein
MGADFICSIVFIDKKLPRNWEKIIDSFDFSKEDIRGYAYNNNVDGSDDVRLDIVLSMIQAVKDFHRLIKDSSREIEVFKVPKARKCGGYKFVAKETRRMCITGGMSWGYAPTDAFSVFSKIVDMPNSLLERIGLSTEF